MLTVISVFSSVESIRSIGISTYHFNLFEILIRKIDNNIFFIIKNGNTNFFSFEWNQIAINLMC